jgi:putative salt-induced outer membrane protein YdiY
MFSRKLGILLVSAAIVMIASVAYGRAKTDIVILVNGDHLTGEIKQLDRGKLTLNTDAMSKAYIEWADVDSLSSQYYFEIEDEDGYKYYGTPILSSDDEFRIIQLSAIINLHKEQVIRITPIEKTFWQRINGSISFGVSYTKGSDIGRLDAAFNAVYRVEKNSVELSMSTITTTERDDVTTTRSDASLTYKRLFQRKLFADVSSVLYRNDELGIARRITLGTGVGAHLVHTNSSLLESTLGISANREWATDPLTAPTNNIEGVLSTGLSVYKYNTPKTDLSSSAAVYPRLPHFDRWRVDVEVSYTQEIIKDFTLILTFYDNYNSEPPSETASTNDWGFTTSFGYTF